MFDPSKLDLDLDENLDNNGKQRPKPSESDKISDSKTSIPEGEISTESKEESDFLGNLMSTNNDLLNDNKSDSSIKSEKNIQQDKEPELIWEFTWENTLWEDNAESENNNTENTKEKEVIETKIESEDETVKDNTESESNSSYGVEDDTKYDKELVQKEKEREIEKTEEAKKIIYDINVKNIQDIFNKLVENNYDFVTIEPFDDFIKIIYRKDKIEKETIFIKYPAYTLILIKAKTLTQLKVDETESSQEWSWNIVLKSKGYKVLSKTAPGGYGEKLFLKLQETQKKIQKEKKTISFWQILGFLWAALFAALLIGWGFLTFVLLNSSTVADLTFFNNLWVDVWSIRDFTSKLVNGLFSVIILIETLFLFTFTFKAILTKKEFKKEKIARIMLSVFFIILTVLSAFLWITLSKKINELKGQNYGKMLTYDNAKYLSPIFDENGSLVDVDESLIGPVTLRFDISEILNQLVNDNNYKPQKITWIFWNTEIEKPINDLEIIHTFSTQDLHIVDLKIDVLNALGEPEVIEKNVAKLNIDHVVNINEKKVAWGGTIYQFDANNLKDLWKLEWFYIPDLKGLSDSEQTKTISKSLKKPANKGYLFDSKILYDEEMILGIKILSGWDEKEGLDKIFIFSWDNSSDDIKAEIKAEANLNNSFKYILSAENIETILWNWNIKHFLWRIWDKTIKNEAILTDLEASSEIEYIFKSYGDFPVYLDIVDSRWNTQTIEKIITIEKKLELSREVRIQNNSASIDNLTYNEKLHEYVIDEIWVPTEISLDARSIKATDINYVLRSVEWDFDSDDDIDSTDNNTTYEVAYEGRHEITGIFHFEHRRKPEDKIIMKETFYIEWVKKEAQLIFDIKKSRDYVPVIASFDASKSQVKNENIVKFTWDYWDGTTPEITDAIVPGHKYSKPGDYIIKLSVTTESWKVFSATKKLILKPKPQSIKITTSLKKAPTYQPIDFLSDKSEGQITSYFWDFWDGGTSTKANPSYQYVKSGSYTVKLRLDFANNNVRKDEINIEIFDE